MNKINLIAILSITSLASKAMAGGIQDGRFFIGASANIERNSYEFTKTRSNTDDTLTQINKIKSEITALEVDKTKEEDKKTTYTDDLNGKLLTEDFIQKLGDVKVSDLSKITFLEVFESATNHPLSNTSLQTFILSNLTFKTDAYLQYINNATSPPTLNASNIYSYLECTNLDTTIAIAVTNDKISKAEANQLKASLAGFFVGRVKNINNDIVAFNNNIVSFNTQLLEKRGKLKALESLIKGIDKLKSYNASKISSNISLLAGYRFNIENFGFITEIGFDIDLGSSAKIGDISKNEIELKRNSSYYISQKIGYNFLQNNLSYVNIGISFANFKPRYDGIIQNSKDITPFIIGIGNESVVNKNLHFFAEFNINLGGKFDVVRDQTVPEKAGEIKISSQQFKLGFRYYL
jgi:hypothetical protein